MEKVRRGALWRDGRKLGNRREREVKEEVSVAMLARKRRK